MAKRRKYSAEFKHEAVGLTHQPGANVSQVARDIGVGSSQLFRWRRELAEDSGAFRGGGVARDQEVRIRRCRRPPYRQPPPRRWTSRNASATQACSRGSG